MNPIDFYGAKLLKELLQRLSKLRENRKAALAEIEETFEHPANLAEIYIEPKCQHHNPTDYDEDEGAFPFIKADVFTFLSGFFSGEDLLREGRSQLFILSDAGMGKTSLLVMLKLSHLLSMWPQKYHCTLLKLDGDTLDKIGAIRDKPNTILLLDGLDEDPMSYRRIEQRLKDLLSATAAFRRVIISCRTQFFPEGTQDQDIRPGKIEIHGYICPVIYLSLFDANQVEQYLKKRFSKKYGDDFPAFLTNAKAILANMHSLKFRPLLLAHIEDLIGSGNTEWDEYSVYNILVDRWLAREERRLNKNGNPAGATKQKLLVACMRIAVKMQEDESRSIDLRTLLWLANVNERDDKVELFDIRGRSLLNKRSDGSYRFSHYSIQEFLIARDVISNRQNHVLKPLHCTDLIMRFVLLGRKADTCFSALNCDGLTLKGVKFGAADMKHMRLNNSQLATADFSNADLEFALLQKADANSCVFTGALLAHADFAEADLSEARLDKCNLKQSKLYKSKCNLAVFDGSDLSHSDLRLSDLSDASFAGANLTGARLTGTTLKACDLTSATVNKADFTEANLAGCDLSRILGNIPLEEQPIFKGAQLGASKLPCDNWDKINFSEALLVEANLAGRNLSGANLSGANLSQANLTGSTLTDCKLDKAIFDGVNLSEAVLIKSRCSEVIFKNFHAQNADFSGCILENSDFTGAKLNRARFVGAQLKLAKFKGADLSDVDFTDANLDGVNYKGSIITVGTRIAEKQRLIWSLVNEPISRELLANIDLANSLFEESRFEDVRLDGIRFEKATFVAASFKDSVLENCNFSDAEFSGVSFNNSVVRQCIFRGAFFSKCDFSGADLSHLSLVNLSFDECNFTGADLHGADFSGANLSKSLGLSPWHIESMVKDDKTKPPKTKESGSGSGLANFQLP